MLKSCQMEELSKSTPVTTKLCQIWKWIQEQASKDVENKGIVR